MNIPTNAITYLEDWLKAPAQMDSRFQHACQTIINFILYNNAIDFSRHIFLANNDLVRVNFEKEHHPLTSIRKKNWVLLGHWILKTCKG